MCFNLQCFTLLVLAVAGVGLSETPPARPCPTEQGFAHVSHWDHVALRPGVSVMVDLQTEAELLMLAPGCCEVGGLPVLPLEQQPSQSPPRGNQHPAHDVA